MPLCSAFRSTIHPLRRALGRAHPSALHSALQLPPFAERLVEHTPLLCIPLYNPPLRRALGRAHPSALHFALQSTPFAERLAEQAPNHAQVQPSALPRPQCPNVSRSQCPRQLSILATQLLSHSPSRPHTPPASPEYTDSGGSYRAWPSPSVLKDRTLH